MDLWQQNIVRKPINNEERSVFKSVSGLLQSEFAHLFSDLPEFATISVKSPVQIRSRAGLWNAFRRMRRSQCCCELQSQVQCGHS
jgi:hypothetical protein